MTSILKEKDSNQRRASSRASASAARTSAMRGVTCSIAAAAFPFGYLALHEPQAQARVTFARRLPARGRNTWSVSRPRLLRRRSDAVCKRVCLGQWSNYLKSVWHASRSSVGRSSFPLIRTSSAGAHHVVRQGPGHDSDQPLRERWSLLRRRPPTSLG